MKIISSSFFILVLVCNVSACAVIDTLSQINDSVIELEVATYNILSDKKDGCKKFDSTLNPDWGDYFPEWDDRKSILVDHINSHKPDVIGMQEVTRGQLDYLLTQLSTYTTTRGRSNTQAEYSAIFYNKKRFTVAKVRANNMQEFCPSNTPMPSIQDIITNNYDCLPILGSEMVEPDSSRIINWVLLEEINTSKRFYVYNTHFKAYSECKNDIIRCHASAQMVDLINGREFKRSPYIILGDFNSGPERNDPYINDLKNALNAVDLYRAAHPEISANEATHGGSSGKKRGKRIDLLYASPNSMVVTAHIYQNSFFMNIINPKTYDCLLNKPWFFTYGHSPASDHYLVTSKVLLATNPCFKDSEGILRCTAFSHPARCDTCACEGMPCITPSVNVIQTQ